MLSLFILYLSLTANPVLEFCQAPLQEQQQPSDSVGLLSRTWVLRKQFNAQNGKMEPVPSHEKLKWTFRENGSYSINRYYGVPDAGSVEEGRWELDASKGVISMQTRQVDGKTILTTMLPRWEVREITGNELVLRFFAMSGAYMVFEAEK